MKYEIATTVHAVAEEDWDRLARHAGLYLSHRWLAGEETDPTATTVYVLVRDADGGADGGGAGEGDADAEGPLLAAAPLHLVHTEPNSLYAPPRPASGAPPPQVVAGARRGYHNTPLIDPELPPHRRDACLTLLRDAARTYARTHGTAHWWPYLTTPAAELLGPLYPSPPVEVEQDALIPLPGTGFDDYLGSLPSKRRVAVRRERVTFQTAGPRVRHLALGACVRDAGRLLAAQQNTQGHRADTTDVMTALLERQVASMGDRARVAAVHDGHAMVAFGLYYHFGGTTWVRAIGTDPSRPVPFAYFNLAYYLPIADGYRAGTTALHAGMKSIAAKRLRGARISGLHALSDA
ncbi:peptidogalycan biosysnthesis protein [Streptomyces sp. NPDC101733]|uniref:peptidogalycan biosysnthesis protein n=1 Tax=unclassified Streptomyces TaxID=2593676 RepID=UPI0037FEE0DD